MEYRKTDSGDYVLVLEYAPKGSLRDNLREISQMKWKDKLTILLDIACDLKTIHFKNLIHRDLHSGNILQNSLYDAYIADLGLLISASRAINIKSNGVYGVLPYIAPEVLNGEPYTIASDIYSFGVIMWEVSTGKLHFYDQDHDHCLIQKICNGLLPEFSKEIPHLYVHLANECMNINPSKRPSAYQLYKFFCSWLNEEFYTGIFNSADEKSVNKHESKLNVNINVISTTNQLELLGCSNLDRNRPTISRRSDYNLFDLKEFT